MTTKTHGRKFTFYLSWPDVAVTHYLLKRGHKVAAVYDETVDCVIFPGGEDILPIFYGEPRLPGTNCNFVRDMAEVRLFHKLELMGTPKIGICRGAQLLNVLSGGSLWQDVNNHGQSHMVKVFGYNTSKYRDSLIRVTSDHHQMMIPGSEATVLMWSKQSTRKDCAQEKWTWTADDGHEWNEPEAIYYWHSNSFCYQPHPEYEGHAMCEEIFWHLAEHYVLPGPSQPVEKKA